MFVLLKGNAKKSTSFAFINADWRDFQGKTAWAPRKLARTSRGSVLCNPAYFPKHFKFTLP